MTYEQYKYAMQQQGETSKPELNNGPEIQPSFNYKKINKIIIIAFLIIIGVLAFVAVGMYTECVMYKEQIAEKDALILEHTETIDEYKEEEKKREEAEKKRVSEAAGAINSKIYSIGDVTAEDEELIKECRDLYDAADEAVKKSVSRYSELTEAERLLALAKDNPLPANGKTTVSYKDTAANPLAPLSFDTTQCESDLYHYIKIVDYNTDEVKQTVFIHPQKKVSIKMPLGDYKIRYGTGKFWYGPDEAFGTGGSYSKADEKLSFTKDSKKVYGRAITLYKVEGGNYETSSIGKSNF